MKTCLNFVIAVSLFLFTTNAFANSCVEMEYGNVCIDIQNNGNGNYELVRNFTMKKKVEYNMYMIDCQILLPNGVMKEMGTCNQPFEYKNGKSGEVKFYIYLQGEKQILKYNYNFVNIDSKEIKDIKSVYKIWSSFTKKLKSKFPKLSNNADWETASKEVYTELGKFLKGNSQKLNSYKDVENLIKNFVKYTIENK